ncbi:hypothetical protein Tco_1021275 [Tanacetum coccineum]
MWIMLFEVPPPPNHARHPSPFFNPNLIGWNRDDIIVISSNDEDDEEEDIPTAWPFLLGVEAGTVPFGKELKYKLISTCEASSLVPVTSFRAFVEDVNRTSSRKSAKHVGL